MENENGSTVMNFFKGLGEKLAEPAVTYVWDYFGQTKTGAQVEQKIEGGVISSYLNNPVVILGLVLVAILILNKAFGKR